MSVADLEPRDRKWINTLANQASSIARVAGVRVIAALVEGQRLLGVGYNSYKTHPLQARFSSNPYAIYLHAEIAALAHAKYEELEGATMYVVRVGAGGELRLAKPCIGCQKALIAFDVGRVIWSTEG